MKKLTALILVLALTINLFPTSFAYNDVTLAGKVSIYAGDTTRWTANQWVWWTSGNPGVATIDQNGNIRALRAGQTHITATAANGEKKTVTLLVYNKPATTLSLAGAVSTYVGSTIKWTANQWVWWTSGNPGVAAIDQNGNIKALRAGKTHITATAANGEKKTVTLVVYNRPGMVYITNIWNDGCSLIRSSGEFTIDNYGNVHSNVTTVDSGRWLEFNIQKKYKRFKMTLFRHRDEIGTVYIKIIADGKTIYISPKLGPYARPIYVDVDVSGYDRITIESYSSYWAYSAMFSNAAFYQ